MEKWRLQEVRSVYTRIAIKYRVGQFDVKLLHSKKNLRISAGRKRD
jgi:hypothetical protein